MRLTFERTVGGALCLSDVLDLIKSGGAKLEKLCVGVPEGAEMAGVGKTLMWGVVARREIPVIRLGRRVLIRVEDLKAWLAKQAEAGQ